jgi:hypothetical protein
MNARASVLALVLLSIAALSACGGGGNYAQSAYGTSGGYSFKNVQAKPANLMMARKIERPLYLVLDPARVKNEWDIATPACEVSGPGCEHFKLFDAHEFVRRDLKTALLNYFNRVEVVAPGALPASGSYVVADVKIDDIKLRQLVTGALTYTLIQMTWGFAMRKNEEKDYSFSFAGTAESSESYPTFEAGLGQLVERAIPAMLKKWTEGGGFDHLAS